MGAVPWVSSPQSPWAFLLDADTVNLPCPASLLPALHSRPWGYSDPSPQADRLHSGPPTKVHIPVPRAYKYVTLHDKGGLTDVIKLRVLRWRLILDYMGWGPMEPQESCQWEAGGSEVQGCHHDAGVQHQSFGCCTAGHVDGCTMSQRMQATSRCWKRRGNRFSPGAPTGVMALRTPRFWIRKAVSDL